MVGELMPTISLLVNCLTQRAFRSKKLLLTLLRFAACSCWSTLNTGHLHQDGTSRGFLVPSILLVGSIPKYLHLSWIDTRAFVPISIPIYTACWSHANKSRNCNGLWINWILNVIQRSRVHQIREPSEELISSAGVTTTHRGQWRNA